MGLCCQPGIQCCAQELCGELGQKIFVSHKQRVMNVMAHWLLGSSSTRWRTRPNSLGRNQVRNNRLVSRLVLLIIPLRDRTELSVTTSFTRGSLSRRRWHGRSAAATMDRRFYIVAGGSGGRRT